MSKNKTRTKKSDDIYFDNTTCRLLCDHDGDLTNRVDALERPLSVILQVTRRCPFSCVFCSETEPCPDPTLPQLRDMKEHLEGVCRVFLSGGEPLLREDFAEIVDIFGTSFVLGLATNASVPDKLIPILKKRIAFVNIGLDGPRNTTSRIRGDYDTIMKGVFRFRDHKIPISLTCVVLSSTIDSVLYVCQIADVVGARKVKLVLPVPKGNAAELDCNEFLSYDAVESLFDDIVQAKSRYGWTPRITLTAWTRATEGYSILVYPNGDTVAWPVYETKDKVKHLGNLIDEPIKDIWQRYPYKLNHLKKYLGESIFLA